jgi:hypothetical protein
MAEFANAFKYDAFIAYAGKRDRTLAQELRHALEESRQTDIRPLRVFLDDAMSGPGIAWPESLRQALRLSRHLVLIASPFAVGSDYVRATLRWWREHHGLDGLILVLAGGDMRDLYPQLSSLQYLDFRGIPAAPDRLRYDERFVAGIEHIRAQMAGAVLFPKVPTSAPERVVRSSYYPLLPWMMAFSLIVLATVVVRNPAVLGSLRVLVTDSIAFLSAHGPAAALRLSSGHGSLPVGCCDRQRRSIVSSGVPKLPKAPRLTAPPFSCGSSMVPTGPRREIPIRMITMQMTVTRRAIILWCLVFVM